MRPRKSSILSCAVYFFAASHITSSIRLKRGVIQVLRNTHSAASHKHENATGEVDDIVKDACAACLLSYPSNPGAAFVGKMLNMEDPQSPGHFLGLSNKDNSEEGEWLDFQRATATEAFTSHGWEEMAKSLLIGTDPGKEAGGEVGVMLDLYNNKDHPKQFLLVFRGSETQNDFRDNVKFLLPQMRDSAFAEIFLQLFTTFIAPAPRDREWLESVKNGFLDFVVTNMIRHQFKPNNANQTLFEAMKSGALTDAEAASIADSEIETLADIARRGYFSVLEANIGKIIAMMEERAGSREDIDLVVTGHSAGGARAHYFAEMFHSLLGKCPRVINFNAPGYTCLKSGWRCPTEEYDFPADFFSTAIVSPPETRTGWVVDTTKLIEVQHKVAGLCGPLVHMNFGRLKAPWTDKAFTACRHVTHTMYAMYDYLVTQRCDVVPYTYPEASCP